MVLENWMRIQDNYVYGYSRV